MFIRIRSVFADENGRDRASRGSVRAYWPPYGVRRMSGSLLCDLMVFLFTMVQDLIASFYNLFGLGTIEPLNIGSVLGCNL
jgi:hypothetical protein